MHLHQILFDSSVHLVGFVNFNSPVSVAKLTVVRGDQTAVVVNIFSRNTQKRQKVATDPHNITNQLLIDNGISVIDAFQGTALLCLLTFSGSLVVLWQGERIIKLAEMCRRMETEEEKILPFYASSLTTEEEGDVDAAVMEAPNEKLAKVIHFFMQIH